jgi:hypothetical protein
MSFDDAGAVPASPSLSKQPSLVIRDRGRLWTRLASWPLGRLPAQLGSLGPTLLDQANVLGPPPCLPLVIAVKMEKPRAVGFSLSGHGGSGDSLARHRVAVPLCFPAEGQRIF